MLIFAEHSPFSGALVKVGSSVDINGIAAPGRLRVSGRDAHNSRFLDRTRRSLEELLLLDRSAGGRNVDDDLYLNLMLYCSGLKKVRLELDEDSFRAPLLDKILATQGSSIEHLWIVLMANSATNYRLPLDIMPSLKSVRIVDSRPEKYIPVFNTYSSATMEELHITGRFMNWQPVINAVRRNLHIGAQQLWHTHTLCRARRLAHLVRCSPLLRASK